MNIQVICSNKEEHKKRVEAREAEISEFKFPTWEEVENREYHSWNSERIVVDTAGRAENECFEELKAFVNSEMQRQGLF